MSRFWSESTRRLSPYVPGEQPKVADLIKLNTNEHPLAPSARALDAIASVTPDSLRRYPDPESSALIEVIADVEQLPAASVFVGNGSDEVLAHVFQALLTSAPAVLAPDITYSFYPVWADLYGLRLETIPLCEDFSLDLAALAASDKPLLLANPNAPTGMAVSLEDISALVSSNPDRLVVVDEAYYGFGAESAARLLPDADNLVVTRSLSKSHALAGLRVGYALAHPELIQGLVRVKDSFNSYPLDALAQAGAAAALADAQWLADSSAVVAENRDWLSTQLRTMGFEVCPSLANFVFARHPQVSGADLFAYLRQNNILVRRWDKPRIGEHLRITIGTRSQCQTLVDRLQVFFAD